MKIRKMSFENNSFLLSDNETGLLSTIEWNSVAVWLRERNMKFNMQGGVLTLYRDIDSTMFALRWCSE